MDRSFAYHSQKKELIPLKLIDHSQKKILLLGSNSFAGTGMFEKLINEDYDVDVFLRGEERREGNNVFGNVWSLITNKYLNDYYDTIINFIIIKNSSVEENLRYIKELVKCCEIKKVRHLIQISSISVYPNTAKFINEESPIEKNHEYKGIYAAVKVAVDNYLNAISFNTMHISYVRPGFILTKDRTPSLAGIMKRLSFGFGLLLGNKETVLPTIDRDRFQNAVVKISRLALNDPVYLILNNSTKYALVKDRFTSKIIQLPKHLTLLLSNLLFILRIFNKKQFKQIQGLFKTTVFDPSHTENILKIKF